MSEFYNAEYLSERLAAVCKERDELKRICEKQAEMNGRVVAMALELDEVKAELAKAKAELEDERYRHDRLQDFEVAESQQLAKVKAERDALLAKLEGKNG